MQLCVNWIKKGPKIKQIYNKEQKTGNFCSYHRQKNVFEKDFQWSADHANPQPKHYSIVLYDRRWQGTFLWPIL